MSTANGSKKGKLYCRDMTVANIRRKEGADFVEVVFLESARFYRLLKENHAYGDILKKLENALSDAEPIKVCFESIESDTIEEVHRSA